MTRFERVREILDAAVGGPTQDVGVHGAFWRLPHAQFLARRIQGMLVVQPGNGAGSPLIQALKGEAPFGADLPDPPPGARFSRMPAGLDPVLPVDIAFIEQWITDGAPETDPVGEEMAGVFSWQATNAPISSSRTDDLWFTSPEVGWAVNSNGQIIHTRDGGETWTVQLQENVYFRCIGMANEQRGWAGTLTQGHRMYQTSDGGAHWQEVANLPALAPSAVCGMSVVSDQVVYASGTNFPNRPARMMKTVDGGTTWTAWEMAEWADLLVDCCFTSPTSGWVVGGKSPAGNPTRANVKPVVLHTEDGGQTWVNRVANLQLPSGEWGWKIFFLNAQIGFVSLENFTTGAILKTTDGGQTWVRLPVNDPQQNANLEGVGFIDENVGWVGGWGDADFERLSSSSTTDGGLHWQNANEIGKAINRFRFFGNPVTVGYASGQTVYKYERRAAPPQPLVGFAAMAFRRQAVQRTVPVEMRRTRSAEGAWLPLSESVSGTIKVIIYGRFGDEVRTLETKVKEQEGGPSIHWDLRDDAGAAVPPGHYILRFIHAGGVFSSLLRLAEPSSQG